MKAEDRKRKVDIPRPLRVLHINSARTWRGGEQQTLWLCQGLQRRGHEVFLACPPNSDLHQRANKVSIAVCPVAMRGEWDLWAVRDLVRAIRLHCIEIVHFHTAHAHTLGLLAAQWTNVPIRILTRRVDFHIHKHPLNRWKYGPALTAILAISGGIRKVLIQNGLEPERVITVHSGIDLQRIQNVSDPSYLRVEFGISEDTLVVGIIAALAPHKHHENFLEAAAIVKKSMAKVRFLIVGEGDLRAELEGLSASLGLSGDVVFTGFRKDVGEIIQILDIFVLSSYLEGMGTSILDALALGKPIVATGVGGIPEIVLHGKNGLLVPPRNPQKLADAILKLAKSPALRDQMGAFGKEHVKNFPIEKTVEQTEAVYTRLVSCVN